MAIFRPLLGELRGSIANNVFSKNRWGAYVRSRTKPVDPFTVKQQAQRALMQTLNQNWKGLTAIARDNWAAYAANTPTINSLGDQIFLTGRLMFLKINLYLGLFPTGISIQLTSPLTPGLGNNPEFTLTGNTTDGIEMQSLALNNAGDQFQLLVSFPLGQTRNFYKGPWAVNIRQTGIVAIPTTLIIAANVAIGQRYFVAVRRWDSATLKLATGFTLQIIDILV